METRREIRFSTSLRNILNHTRIRGNDLADVVAKLAVLYFDNLPPTQTLWVEVGFIAPRPPLWVMLTH